MSERKLREIEVRNCMINNIEQLSLYNHVEFVNAFFGKDYIDNSTIDQIFKTIND